MDQSEEDGAGENDEGGHRAVHDFRVVDRHDGEAVVVEVAEGESEGILRLQKAVAQVFRHEYPRVDPCLVGSPHLVRDVHDAARLQIRDEGAGEVVAEAEVASLRDGDALPRMEVEEAAAVVVVHNHSQEAEVEDGEKVVHHEVHEGEVHGEAHGEAAREEDDAAGMGESGFHSRGGVASSEVDDHGVPRCDGMANDACQAYRQKVPRLRIHDHIVY